MARVGKMRHLVPWLLPLLIGGAAGAADVAGVAAATAAAATAAAAALAAAAASGGGGGDDTRGLPVRRLSGSDLWLATAMHYMKGHRDEEYFAFLGFKSGGVAKIFLNTGEVLWAHAPTSAGGSIKSLLYKMGVVVVATDSGKVQAWDGEDGHLKWERACPGTVPQSVLTIGGGDDGFGFACASEVEVRTREGTVAWAALAPMGFVVKAAGEVDSHHNFCVLAVSATKGALSIKYDSYKGKVMSQTDAPELVARALAGNNYITTGGMLVWSTPGQVHTYQLCGDEDVHSEDSPAVQEAAVLEAIQDTPAFFSVTSGKATGVFVAASRHISQLYLADGPAFVGPVHGAMYGETARWIAVGTNEQAGCRVRIINAKKGHVEYDAAEPGAYMVAKYGRGVRVVAQEKLRGDLFRAFIATGNPDSLLAIQGRDLHWARNGFGTDSVLLQSNLSSTTATTTAPMVEL